jgi:ferredoxin
MNFQISFENNSHPPVNLPKDAHLSESLTIENSPILFGCRIGICGTCAIQILEGAESLHPRSEEENNFLETMAPGKPELRLACQIQINANIKVKKVQI